MSHVLWHHHNRIYDFNRSVPLDYFDEAAGKASLSLARYLATDKANKLGSLLMNPGGPGGSGVGFVHSTGKHISEIVNGQYDIVSASVK